MTKDGNAIIDALLAGVKRMGWSETARRTGLRREALHRAFKTRCPSFMTIQLVADAVGVRLVAKDSDPAIGTDLPIVGVKTLRR